MKRHTAQPGAMVAERRVMEEKVKSERESIMEEGGISGEVQWLDVKIVVAAEEGESRQRHRRLRRWRRKQRVKETMTVTARTITMMRMLGQVL